jgi:hypothetical protein
MSSCDNFRAFADQLALQQACVRDHWIEQNGLCVTVMEPSTGTAEENKVDFYSDFCTENRIDSLKWLVPLWKDYYTILDVLGEDNEDPLPLEALVKTTDHWFRDSIVRLPVLNTENQLIDKYWRVLSGQQRHLEAVYDKKIKLVPARDHVVQGIN